MLIALYVIVTEVGPVTYYLIHTVAVVDNANMWRIVLPLTSRYNGYFQQLLTTLQDVITL